MKIAEHFRNGTRTEKRLSVADIRSLCGGEIIDAGVLDFVDGVSTADRILANRVVFIERFDPNLARALAKSTVKNALIIAVQEYRDAIPQARLISPRPRVQFSAIVRALFEYQAKAQTVLISKSAIIGPNAKISVGVTVGDGSTIGAGTLIYPNVTIGERVHIGRNCCIKSGTVIGQPGFGVYRDEHNVPHHMPHVAGVIIQDNVGIGALNTLAGGTIHPTIVEHDVKTDDQVHIAHNCHIGARTLITACAELSGSVSIGADCWIGPNASIRDGVSIGDGALVGIGANVIAPVPPGVTVYGNPARERLPATRR
jgi:UDP-3-O-[3-hydroxymyristoyl] glucosamine N-acyltransferase